MCCVGMGPMTLVVLASSFLPVQLQCSIFLSLSRSVALCKWGIRHEALFSTSPSHGSAPCLTETASHRALPVEGTPPPHTHTHIHTPLALPNHGNYKTSAASSPLSLDSSNQPLLRALTKPPRPQCRASASQASDCEWRSSHILAMEEPIRLWMKSQHTLAMEETFRLWIKSQPHPCHGGPNQTVHEEPTTPLPWRTHSDCAWRANHILAMEDPFPLSSDSETYGFLCFLSSTHNTLMRPWDSCDVIFSKFPQFVLHLESWDLLFYGWQWSVSQSLLEMNHRLV